MDVMIQYNSMKPNIDDFYDTHDEAGQKCNGERWWIRLTGSKDPQWCLLLFSMLSNLCTFAGVIKK